MVFCSLLSAAVATLAISGASASPARRQESTQFALTAKTLDGTPLPSGQFYGPNLFPYPADIRRAAGDSTLSPFHMYTLDCQPYYGIHTNGQHGLVDGFEAENGSLGFESPIGGTEATSILGYGRRNAYNSTSLSFDTQGRLTVGGKRQFAACYASPIAGVSNIRWLSDPSNDGGAVCTRVEVYKVNP